MPVAAFIPGGLIKSSDLNSNFSDIATALTQSLATTGVSTMTGPINAAAGLVTTPSITFNGATKTGFYLAGANQIGITVNGVQAATVNSDTSVNFAGNVTVGGVLSASALPIGFMGDFAGTTAPSKWVLCYGQQLSTTTYAALFAVIGTTYGSGAGTFGIPDCRGRATFGQDNMGGTAANRITIAGLNFDGTVLGNSGGLQNHQTTLGEVPTGITSSNTATVTFTSNQTNVIVGSVTNINFSGGAGTTTSGNGFNSLATTQISSTGSVNVTSNNTGGNPHTVLNPAIIINKIMYAGV